MSDKKIVSFEELSKQKAKENTVRLEKEKHDFLLDQLEEAFPDGGIIITLDDGHIGLSACIEDYETFRDVLVHALIKVCEQGGMEDEPEN
jgi:hypothetical protein